jgi:hypothetical protein
LFILPPVWDPWVRTIFKVLFMTGWPKRRQIYTRRRGITQKLTYLILNTAKVKIKYNIVLVWYNQFVGISSLFSGSVVLFRDWLSSGMLLSALSRTVSIRNAKSRCNCRSQLLGFQVRCLHLFCFNFVCLPDSLLTFGFHSYLIRACPLIAQPHLAQKLKKK